ncbi:hypothetical protein D3C75_568830 [compost metagenome]
MPPIVEIVIRPEVLSGKPLIHNSGFFIVKMLLKASLEPVRTRLPIRLRCRFCGNVHQITSFMGLVVTAEMVYLIYQQYRPAQPSAPAA